jgi:hypothetical protein
MLTSTPTTAHRSAKDTSAMLTRFGGCASDRTNRLFRIAVMVVTLSASGWERSSWTSGLPYSAHGHLAARRPSAGDDQVQRLNHVG